MADHPPTMAEVLVKARESSEDYDRILREIPPPGSTTAWSASRDHRLRVAADGMRLALAALLDVAGWTMGGEDTVRLMQEFAASLARDPRSPVRRR